MSRTHYDTTYPEPKKAGIALTWRNLKGVRPVSAQTAERNARIQRLRTLLQNAPKDAPDMTAADVAKLFGVLEKPTAEKYLAMARAEVQK